MTEQGTTDHAASSGKNWAVAATIGLGLAVLAILMAAAAGPGYQAGLWDLGFGLRNMFAYSIWVAGAGALLGLVGLVLASRRGDAKLRNQGVGGLILGLALVVFVGNTILGARSVPAIHDITTNLDDPPSYVTLSPRDYGEEGMQIRIDGREDLAALPVAEQLRILHTEAYADLQPLLLGGVSVSDATGQAEQVAQAMGWEVAHVDRAAGRVEATDTTTWFGFKDDVLIRIREHEAGALVDVRSVSRVGGSDVGKNAARIREFLAALSGE